MTRELALLHTRAQVLASAGAWPHLFSPFEQELLETIARRRAAFGDQAAVSDAEETALRGAVSGVEASIRRLFHSGGLRRHLLAICTVVAA